MNDAWTIRSAIGDDLPFIYSSWLTSYWDLSIPRQEVRKPIFFKEYPKIIDTILQDDDTHVFVAQPKEDDLICGYIVFTDNILHYILVKQSFQKWGIAKSLLQHAEFLKEPVLDNEIFYTHQTHCSLGAQKKYPQFIYNPYLIYKQGEESYGKTAKRTAKRAGERNAESKSSGESGSTLYRSRSSRIANEFER